MNAAKVSGNLDAPEGGFDAIMQAIACEVCQIYKKYIYCEIYMYFFCTVSRVFSIFASFLSKGVRKLLIVFNSLLISM